MSENSKPPRNYVWYRLAGKSEQAMRRVLEADRNGEKINQHELKELADTLGYTFAVEQQGPDCAYAVFPAIFGHPVSADDGFFLMAPIGYRKDANGETHFVPKDGEPLTEKEVNWLERWLFSAWCSSPPIIERRPKPLSSPPPPAPPSGPKP